MNTVLRALTAIALAMSAGCATQTFDLHLASAGSTLRPVVVNGSAFNIQTLQPDTVAGKTLRVYIEGDGRAWITSSTVSDDPTPVESMMAKLAISDPSRAAVYMARPCQFTWSAQCAPRYWTGKRFSAAMVAAQSEALDILKSQYGIQQFELVGYSGGATIALLLAAKRDDVAQVQTIAGNLDPAAWTRIKHLSPLSGSLNPADFAERLATIPQRHLVGANDKVMPLQVSQQYMLQVQPLCAETVVLNADHASGYNESWVRYRDRPVDCTISRSW